MEFDLFKDLSGRGWFDDDKMVMDPEHKITEFDYENYFNPILLKNKELTSSDEFKHLIRVLNYFSRT
jgi:hypothetical protein